MLAHRRLTDQESVQVRAQYLHVDVVRQKVRGDNGYGNYVAIQLDQVDLQCDARVLRP